MWIRCVINQNRCNRIGVFLALQAVRMLESDKKTSQLFYCFPLMWFCSFQHHCLSPDLLSVDCLKMKRREATDKNDALWSVRAICLKDKHDNHVTATWFYNEDDWFHFVTPPLIPVPFPRLHSVDLFLKGGLCDQTWVSTCSYSLTKGTLLSNLLTD